MYFTANVLTRSQRLCRNVGKEGFALSLIAINLIEEFEPNGSLKEQYQANFERLVNIGDYLVSSFLFCFAYVFFLGLVFELKGLNAPLKGVLHFTHTVKTFGALLGLKCNSFEVKVKGLKIYSHCF